MAHKVQKVKLDHRVSRVSRVHRELKEKKELLVHKAFKDPRETRVILVSVALRVYKDLKEFRARGASAGLKVFRAYRAPRAFKVLRATLARKALRVLKARRVILAKLALAALP